MAAYGVDVLDPRTSTRRVRVLLDRLPPQARRFGEQWSTESELLAVLIDHVANLTWVTLRAHGAKNAARPRPVPRPASGVTRFAARPPAPAPAGETAGKAGSWAQAARMLGGMPGVQVSTDG